MAPPRAAWCSPWPASSASRSASPASASARRTCACSIRKPLSTRCCPRRWAPDPAHACPLLPGRRAGCGGATAAALAPRSDRRRCARAWRHMSAGSAEGFGQRLLPWFDRHGRHDLPWQHPRTPYRVWLSEIMLQQTQVATVIPYFLRFVESFPTLPGLAAASTDQVMAHWAGLGYYARARNLHAAARRCVEHHGGDLPRDFDALLALPGIGRSTAGAILAQAWGDPFPILDGNVKRVLARWHGIHGWPGTPAVEKRMWALAAGHVAQ